MADVDVTVFVHCKDEYKLNVPQDDDLVHYTAQVYYTGDSTRQCVFKTIDDSEYYQAALEIYYLQDGALLYKDAFVVTCAFGDHATTNKTFFNPVGDTLVSPYEKYKHIHRVHNHTHANSSCSFNIEVLDIREDLVTGAIPLGSKIKLRIYMTAGSPKEQGFHVFNCEALGANDVKPFQFIREGCGEGVIISRTEGFETQGLTADSPYFKAFKLHGSPTVTFECHFYLCYESCDGSSCIHSTTTRKKRSVRVDMPLEITAAKRARHSIKRIKHSDITHFSSSIIHPNREYTEQNNEKTPDVAQTVDHNILSQTKKNREHVNDNNFLIETQLKAEKIRMNQADKSGRHSGEEVDAVTDKIQEQPSIDKQREPKLSSSVESSNTEPNTKIIAVMLMSAALVCLLAITINVTLKRARTP